MSQFAEFNFSLATRIRFGVALVNQVGSEVTALGAHKPLVVTDPGVAEAGLLEPVLGSLRTAGVASAVFQEVTSNPTAENAEQAAAMARAEGCDAVVAVGGGSPMDTAKGAAVVAALGGQVSDYEGWDEVPAQPLPIVAIPTTAGTGSEVSFWAVISDVEDHRKMLIGSTRVAPVVALLDPAMTYTLPASLTAYTGIDALTHAIEAYTATLSNPISDALAIAAVARIGRAFLRVVEDPRDRDARSDMLLASTMAAAAFNSADLGAVHCMSEALGGLYDIHHGLANAILLVDVMAFNAPAVLDEYAEIARALGAKNGDAVEAVKRITTALGLPSLSEVGVREADLPRLAKVAADNISAPSNPRPITEQDFLGLFRKML